MKHSRTIVCHSRQMLAFCVKQIFLHCASHSRSTTAAPLFLPDKSPELEAVGFVWASPSGRRPRGRLSTHNSKSSGEMNGANQLTSSARVQVLRVDFNPRVSEFVSHFFSNQAEINTSIIFLRHKQVRVPAAVFDLTHKVSLCLFFYVASGKRGIKLDTTWARLSSKVSSFPWLSSRAQRSSAAQTEFTGFFLPVGGLRSQGQRLRLWSRGVTVLREMLSKAAVCWVTVLRKHWPP